MRKVSAVRHTHIRRGPLTSAEIKTIEDFVEILQSAQVDRVALESITVYRKKVIGTGAQFTVYDDAGIGHWGNGNLNLPPAVVKCAHFKLVRASQTTTVQDTQNQRRLARSLYQELLTLTRPSLRQHPNIIRLLKYDLIEDGDDQIVVPALVMERATHGSLHDFLQQVSTPLDAQDKVNILSDVTSGLIALHQAGLIHGDVKADNILIFDSQVPSGQKKYVAKLSDFGSVILLDEAQKPNRHVRYHGTRLTNAPETVEQFGKNAIPADMLARCDIYSLGLLYLQVLAGDLDATWTSKTDKVLEHAINFVHKCPDLSEDMMTAICRALEQLLPYNAGDRCVDLSIVLNLLSPFELSDISLEDKEPTTIERSQAEIAKTVERNFGTSNALDFGWGEEEEMPKATQAEIINVIQAQTLEPGAGRAYFLLALAHSRGFGVKADVDLALKSILEAARKGYLPAHAILHVWHDAHSRTVDIDEETQLDWLYNAALWGSVHAAPVLRRKSPSVYEDARKEFHARGGYNQYLYNNQSPPHIKSEEFLEVLQSKVYQPDAEHMADLLQSAAIYGDTALARFLVESGKVDVNLCNRYGESLLVLCCKGGHIDLLHILVAARANAKTRDNTTGLPMTESALHWILAFDDGDQKKAASLLISAGAEVTADISWNHPVIDLPGKFPLGTPFHYATFCNSPSWVQELLHHSGEENCARYTNTRGSSALTPLEYAARYHRYDIIKQLLKGRALGDPGVNALVLHEVSNLPTYESWAISGLLNLPPNKLADLCTSTFLDWRFSLLDQEDELGFTPLLMACYYHSTGVVKCLIERGCNVNAQTPFEHDGRTALNMYSNNQLAYADDNILDLLHAAGANLELGSASGMKPLHYAARDNNVRVARRLLELNVTLDARTKLGLTPLHYAATYGATDVGQLLVDWQADLYAQDGSHGSAWNDAGWSGLTPLTMAVSRHDKGFINLLLEDRFNLDPVARPTSADTIIHFAITEHSPDMLRYVLRFPKLNSTALLDRKNLKGVTPLHLAAGNISRQKHIELLIKACADVQLVSDSGHTTLDIAYQTRERVRTGIEQAKQGASVLFPHMETIGEEADEEEDPQQQSSNSDNEETYDEDGLKEPVMVRKYQLINLPMELECWDETINSLEHIGAKRAAFTPVPDGLLSLD